MVFTDKEQDKENIRSSFYETVLSYRKALLKVVSSIAPSAEVEDIVQDAYVKILQINCDKKTISHPKTLIYKIAKNLALDFNKKSEVRLTDGAVDEQDYGVSEHDGTYQQVLTDDEFNNFCESVRHLPLQCRKVFVMRKIYGFTQKEIAKELNLSQYTVENHTANGMRKCSDFLARKLNDKQLKVMYGKSGLKSWGKQ